MRWPSDLPDPIRRRILGLWSAANGATSVHERAKAIAALGRLQRNHELSDVALNFIAESELQQPSRDIPENIPNIVVLIIELIRLVGIVTSLEIALTSAFWILHTYVFYMFTYTPRLVLQSRETGCGKTVLLELMELLVDQGHKADDTTPAAIYRRLKRQRITYLLDEVEHSDILSEKRFKALYNMGYQGRSGRDCRRRISRTFRAGAGLGGFEVGVAFSAGIAPIDYPGDDEKLGRAQQAQGQQFRNRSCSSPHPPVGGHVQTAAGGDPDAGGGDNRDAQQLGTVGRGRRLARLRRDCARACIGDGPSD
jgi:hypothetical protein